MAIKTLSTTVDADSAGRVGSVVRTLCDVSHSQVRGMVDQGCVTVNGRPCASIATLVTAGDIVSLRYDPTQRYREKKKRWDDRTFTIAHEDDHLIVVDKSAGTLTVPTDKDEPNTLIERVSIYLSHSQRTRQACLVHRLERDVSGLLLFGKHEQIARLLIEQFKEQRPERVYTAIVAGVMPNDEGSYHGHLATGKNLDQFVTRPSPDSQEAITHYRVLKRMPDTTLVEVTLETSTRNQIRVQFAHAGHPVLGDPRYKTKQAQHRRWIRKRIALHAKTLGFEHPVTGEVLMIESALPAAMERFVGRKG